MDIANILQSLGITGPKQNFFQQAANPNVPAAAPMPAAGAMPSPLGVDPMMVQSQPLTQPQQAVPQIPAGLDVRISEPQQPHNDDAPRARRSLLDTVGRISDVLAKVGGAEALYQPTLDAREDRGFMLADHARGVETDGMKQQILGQQVQGGEMELQTQGNAIVGNAIRGLQAIQRTGGDIAKAWPILAKNAGIPDDRAAALGQVFAENPQSIAGMSAMLGAQGEYGLQPFYAKDSAGNLQAYQLGKDGTVQPVTLPEGSQPIDPLKFVDTGGTMTGVGTRSGSVAKILPKQEAPGRAQDRGARVQVAREGNQSRERIAAMPARGKSAAATEKGGADSTSLQSSLTELRSIYSDLQKMGAMVSPKQSTGLNIAARVRASGVGQMLEGAVGTEAQTLRDRIGMIRPGLVQSIAKATGMTSKQLDSNADVKLFMKTVTDPTASYEANMTAIKRLERLAAKNSKGATSARPAARPAAAPARRGTARVAPKAATGGKPSVSNW